MSSTEKKEKKKEKEKKKKKKGKKKIETGKRRNRITLIARKRFGFKSWQDRGIAGSPVDNGKFVIHSFVGARL